jgi:hypothetical protein
VDRDQDQKLQERAYEIWEREGRPSDRADENWLQAEAELAGASGPSPSSARSLGVAAAKPREPRPPAKRNG